MAREINSVKEYKQKVWNNVLNIYLPKIMILKVVEAMHFVFNNFAISLLENFAFVCEFFKKILILKTDLSQQYLCLKKKNLQSFWKFF